MSSILYCATVKDFVEYWNSHLMRSNKLLGAPPNDLYDIPQHYGNIGKI